MTPDVDRTGWDGGEPKGLFARIPFADSSTYSVMKVSGANLNAATLRVPSSLIAPALVALLAACASSGTSDQVTPRTPTAATTADLEAIYQARADSALMNVSPADAAFVSGMIHHHAQALVMSAYAPTNGASPSIRTLTGRIINAQKDEIRVMQSWLGDRGLDVPQVSSDGHVMGGAEHDMHMPGMLTPEQLSELSVARGPEFDRLFLTYMIQHHEGAVTMVLDLFATDGAAQDDLIFKIASDIQVDQITEINRMKLMLEAMTRPSSGKE